jgi:2-oxoglutarate ferredoxin oxidoreductase subunit alpha
LQAGYNYADTTETFTTRYSVSKAKMDPGTYRSIMGNQALAYGLIAAADKSGIPMFLGTYPITPASDILHEMSRYKNFGIKTFQAEDEIAGSLRLLVPVMAVLSELPQPLVRVWH